MEKIGMCKGELKDMFLDGKGCICMDFVMFFCGLIGF